jgi:hypothetical protein
LDLLEEMLQTLKTLTSKYPEENLIEEMAECMDKSFSKFVCNSEDFTQIIERFQKTLEKVQQHMDVKFLKPFMNLQFLKIILFESPSLEASRSFSKIIKKLFNRFDKQSGGKNESKSSFESLEKLAMKKLLQEISKKEVTGIAFENQLLFDFGILKLDENNEKIFCDPDAGIAIFGSSYLIEYCEKVEVVDLIIEMVANDKISNYWGLECHNILHFILEDQANQEIYGEHLTKNYGNLKKTFLKETKENYDLIMDLVFSAIKYGEPEKIEQVLLETDEKHETCLHRIAKNSKESLIMFLKAVENENLVDNFDEWLCKTNSDGKTFLFFVNSSSAVEKIFNFLRNEMDKDFIRKLLYQTDNQGETFLSSKQSR